MTQQERELERDAREFVDRQQETQALYDQAQATGLFDWLIFPMLVKTARHARACSRELEAFTAGVEKYGAAKWLLAWSDERIRRGMP